MMHGKARGPLHGLPVTIKDTIETAGLRTTSGSLMRGNFVPASDAPAWTGTPDPERRGGLNPSSFKLLARRGAPG